MHDSFGEDYNEKKIKTRREARHVFQSVLHSALTALGIIVETNGLSRFYILVWPKLTMQRSIVQMNQNV